MAEKAATNQKPKVTKPKAKTTTKPKAKTTTKPKAKTTTVAKPKVTTSKPKAKTTAKPKVTTSKPKAKTTAKPKVTTSKPKVTPKVVAKPKAKTTAKPKQKAKPKTVKSTQVVSKINMENEIKDKKPKLRGKTFYLIILLTFYSADFLFMYFSRFKGGDLLHSLLFAFAETFVVFILIQFNVFKMLINFFRIPIKLLVTNSRSEFKKDKKSKNILKNYANTISLTFYVVLLLLILVTNTITNFENNVPLFVSLYETLITGLVFVTIISSWIYLFNIIPNILEKSIDAKNGFILALSAAVMIIFVIFTIFDITYLSELMIFILIIGFVALLGVNLNMIVGEINIFQNLKKGHSSQVTKTVFLIFFSFHLYVILYASVVAFSIYRWDAEAYNFTNSEYEEVMIDEVYLFDGLVDDVYSMGSPDAIGPIDDVYDVSGSLITNFYDDDGNSLFPLYDQYGFQNEHLYYSVDSEPISFVNVDNVSITSHSLTNKDGELLHNVFYDGEIKGYLSQEVSRDYGDFLYYTVVTISTLGYGDITPNSNYNISQFWGGFLSVYGFTFFALSIGFVSNIAIESSGLKGDE